MDVFEGNSDEINVFVSFWTYVQYGEITPSGRNLTRFCLMEFYFVSETFQIERWVGKGEKPAKWSFGF